jgi:hypothetical protein
VSELDDLVPSTSKIEHPTPIRPKTRSQPKSDEVEDSGVAIQGDPAGIQINDPSVTPTEEVGQVKDPAGVEGQVVPLSADVKEQGDEECADHHDEEAKATPAKV